MTQPDGADIVAELVDRCPEHGTRTETWAECRCAAARETAALLAKAPTGKGRADDTTLRGRIASAIDDVTGGTCPTDIVDAVLAAVQPEMAELADYRNRITWETNCGEHARLLDASYAETARAEQAEAALARVRAFADDLSTWLAPDGIDAQATAASIYAALTVPSPPAP